MGMKIFITGVGGYIGSVVAGHLANLPEIDSITGVVNKTMPPNPLPAKVNLIKMDIRSPELADAVAGHDFLIHSAFVVLWPAKMPAAVRDDINFNGARNVAQAAVKNKLRGFIYASSLAAYDQPLARGKENVSEEEPRGKGDTSVYYWDSKAISEKILIEILEPSQVTWTFLRMGFVIGPQNHATIPGYRNNAASFFGLDPRLQFVQEDDAAEAFALAIRAKMPGIFNVVPDDFICLSDFYKIIGVNPMTVPVWLARLVTFIQWKYFGSPVHSSWVLDTLADFAASNAKLKAKGWQPHYNSMEAIHTALSI